jgi:hypothetical protein
MEEDENLYIVKRESDEFEVMWYFLGEHPINKGLRGAIGTRNDPTVARYNGESWEYMDSSAANMQNLKPCPCGKIPDTLLIADNGAKWAYAFGDCCNEWHIEFRTAYNPIDSKECMARAVTAWNLADRNAAEHSAHLTAFGAGWRVRLANVLFNLGRRLANGGGR